MNKQKIFIVALFSIWFITSKASEPIDTTNYSNYTVETEVAINSSSTLTIANITITPTGKLTLVAPTRITLNPTIDVQLGGELILFGGTSFAIDYSYDEAGNRILRRKAE